MLNLSINREALRLDSYFCIINSSNSNTLENDFIIRSHGTIEHNYVCAGEGTATPSEHKFR